MTTATATELTPVLKLGSTELPFPDPSMDPEAVKQMYEPNYPELGFAHLAPGRTEGDKLIYDVEKPPAKTKG